MSETITYTCTRCGETHAKPRTRGRKPLLCEPCRPFWGRPLDYQATVTVRCALCGQEHTKPRTVGRPARFCDDCRPLRGRFKGYQAVDRFKRRLEAAAKRMEPQRCERCGNSFTGRERRFCSEDCSSKYLIEKRNPMRYQPRACPCCGAVFTPGYRDQRQIYCSEVCRARFPNNRDKSKRRAMMRATAVEPIDPIVVFERDGWVCIICGVSTPPELRGTTDPRAPEPDHDVPLGRGGTHTYDNINCTCRACNQAKGLMTLEEYQRTLPPPRK